MTAGLRLRIQHVGLAAIGFFSIAGCHSASANSKTDESNLSFVRSEPGDRGTDAAAGSAFETAVFRLKRLAVSKKGSPEEVAILLKLADIQHKAAAVEFRLAGGRGDLKKAHDWFQQSLEPLTRILTVYPKSPQASTALIMRAKTYRELAQKEAAADDYRKVIAQDANSAEGLSASLKLSEIYVELERFSDAVDVLKSAPIKKSDPAYALVQDRISWSQFRLGRFSDAVQTLDRMIAVTLPNAGDGTAGPSSGPTRAQAIDREKALSNLALFKSAGIDAHAPGFTVQDAFEHIAKTCRGEELFQTFSRFAYLLRTKDHEPELIELRDLLVRRAFPATVIGEVSLVLMGYQLNKGEYTAFRASAQELSKRIGNERIDLSKKSELVARWRATLQDQVTQLQVIVNRYRASLNSTGDQSTGITRPSGLALISAYQAILKLPESDLQKTAQLSFNVAEICFSLQEFSAAATYYQWVAEHVNRRETLGESARVRAISARYEELRAAGRLVSDFQVKKLPASGTSSRSVVGLHSSVKEWVRWVDHEMSENNSAELDAFAFEASRQIYSTGEIESAIERLIDFTKKRPTSKYAVPSASLAIDTLVLSEHWSDAFRVVTGFQKFPAFEGIPFAEKLTLTAGDTAYKIVEELARSKSYKDTFEKGEFYLKNYPGHRYRSNAISLLANTAIASGDPRRALTYLSEIPDERLGPEQLALSLNVRAALAEEEFRFADSAEAYELYIRKVAPQYRVSGSEFEGMKQKAVLFAWLSTSKSLLKRVMQNPEICNESASNIKEQLRARCNEVEFLQNLDLKHLKGLISYANFQNWMQTSEKLKLFVRPSGGFPSERGASVLAWFHVLEPKLQLTLRPAVLAWVKSEMESRRTALSAKTPLRPDPVMIQKHQKLVERSVLEVNALSSGDFPELQLYSLILTSQIYADYGTALENIHFSPSMDQESRDLMQGAFHEIATRMHAQANEVRAKALDYARGHSGFPKEFKSLVEATADGSVGPLAQIHEWARKYPVMTDTANVGQQIVASDVLNLACRCDKWKQDVSHFPAEKNFRDLWEKLFALSDIAKLQSLIDYSRNRKIFDDSIQNTFQSLVLFRAGADPMGWERSKDLVGFLPFLLMTFFETYRLDETRAAVHSLVQVGDRGFRFLSATPWSRDVLRAAAWAEVALPAQFARLLENAEPSNSVRVPAGEGGHHED